MWTVAWYTPVSLFTLKPAVATSSGGKTLLCPTPFSIKMALLDAALRTQGQAKGQQLWPAIRDLQLMMALPQRVSVINTFTKIVRPKKNGPSDDNGTGLVVPFGSTIAYREYVSFGGSIGIAAQLPTGDRVPDTVADLFVHISYFGKRGGFVQLQTRPTVFNAAPIGAADTRWSLLTVDQTSFDTIGTLQVLDDCGSRMSFEQANIYSGKRIILGKERVLRHIVLPFQLEQSSHRFSLYQRIN